MANYINSPILFESYVHLDANFENEADAQEALRRAVDTFIHERASHFLYDEVESEVRFKTGSVKAYATIRGSIRDCLGAYDDFAKSVDRLYWFAKKLSDAAVMETSFRTGTFLSAITHTEARPGVIGKLKRTIDDIRSVRAITSDRQAERMIKRLNRILVSIEGLFPQFVDDAERGLVAGELLRILDTVPRGAGRDPVSPHIERVFTEVRRSIVTLLQAYHDAAR